MFCLVEFQTPAGIAWINLTAVQAVMPYTPAAALPDAKRACTIALRNGTVVAVRGTVEETVEHLSRAAQQFDRPANLNITATDEVAPAVQRLTLYQKHRADLATARAELEQAKAEQARVSARHERT